MYSYGYGDTYARPWRASAALCLLCSSIAGYVIISSLGSMMDEDVGADWTFILSTLRDMQHHATDYLGIYASKTFLPNMIVHDFNGLWVHSSSYSIHGFHHRGSDFINFQLSLRELVRPREEIRESLGLFRAPA